MFASLQIFGALFPGLSGFPKPLLYLNLHWLFPGGLLSSTPLGRRKNPVIIRQLRGPKIAVIRISVPGAYFSEGMILRVLFFAVLWLLGGVFLIVTLWALLFVWRGEFTDLATAVYFSVVSVTTVGYGDITVSSHSRMLAGFAAADGFLIFGLDTAALYEALGQLKASHHNADGRQVSTP